MTVLLLKHEALVALGGDLGETPEVVGAAQIYAELAVLARDVSPLVPRVGEGIERLVGDLGDLAVPVLLGVGLDAKELLCVIAHHRPHHLG